jgi:hypothetical protein
MGIEFLLGLYLEEGILIKLASFRERPGQKEPKFERDGELLERPMSRSGLWWADVGDDDEEGLKPASMYEEFDGS